MSNSSSASSLLNLPDETITLIAGFLTQEFELSAHLRNFILTCKRTQFVGDPILYRSLLLGRISDIRVFTTLGQSIARGDKARFVLALEVPDSFPLKATSQDTNIARCLLESLPNLKKLTILRSPVSHILPRKWARWQTPIPTKAPLIETITPSKPNSPSTTFWTPSMFKKLPFQLEQLAGEFADSKTTSALFLAQQQICGWTATEHLTTKMCDWSAPALDAIGFEFKRSSRSTPFGNIPNPSRFRTLVVRGRLMTDLTMNSGISCFENVTTLSIGMLRKPQVTQYDMLDRISRCVPKLLHLTFWTFGSDTMVIGAERQRYMDQLDPFVSLSQVPPISVLRSLLLVIQQGSVPETTLDVVNALMVRCPQLLQLDIVSMRGVGEAYARSLTGQAFRSQNIICRPCLQDNWF